MSAFMPENPSIGYVNLVKGLEDMTLDPSNPYTHSFGTDFLRLLRQDPETAQLVHDAFQDREYFDKIFYRRAANASYAGNLVLRAVHGQIYNQAGYPENHRDPGSWSEDIEEAIRSNFFNLWVPQLDVVSNVESRYAPLHVVGSRIFERQQEPLVIVDIGSSQGHGGKMIATGMRFEPPSPTIKGPGLGDFRHRLKTPVPIKEFINVDKWDVPRDKTMQQWARACSIPPYELTPERIAKYDALESIESDKVRFSVNAVGVNKFFTYNPELEHACDIVFASTVIYQIKQETFDIFMKEARQLLKPGGVIIIQDHVKRRAKNNQLEFIDDWYNPSNLPYRTIIADSLYPEEGFVEIYRWTTGRCAKGTIPDRFGIKALKRLRQSR